MTSLPVLKASTICCRQKSCSACVHAVPGAWPWHGRKFFCGRLHDGTTNRLQPAYLPTLIQRPDAACPIGRWAAATPEDLRGPADAPYAPEPLYHTLWGELHGRPKAMGAWSDEWAWLDAFAARLPCGDCRGHWFQLLQRCPPDWSSRWAYFRWTVTAHNDVSRRLGKPEMSLVEAAKVHGYGVPDAGQESDRPAFEAGSSGK